MKLQRDPVQLYMQFPQHPCASPSTTTQVANGPPPRAHVSHGGEAGLPVAVISAASKLVGVVSLAVRSGRVRTSLAGLCYPELVSGLHLLPSQGPGLAVSSVLSSRVWREVCFGRVSTPSIISRAVMMPVEVIWRAVGGGGRMAGEADAEGLREGLSRGGEKGGREPSESLGS